MADQLTILMPNLPGDLVDEREEQEHLAGRTLARVHPQLGIMVSPYGEVLVPANGVRKEHWTFGCTARGYKVVGIANKRHLVHRLVVETYLGAIPDGYEVDHINRNRSDNNVENLRIVTHIENQRNTAYHDRVTSRDGTHTYENEKQYNKEYHRIYYLTNKDKVLEYQSKYRSKHPDKVRNRLSRYFASHKNVLFSDGSYHWVTNSEAEELLKLPVKERIWKQ